MEWAPNCLNIVITYVYNNFLLKYIDLRVYFTTYRLRIIVLFIDVTQPSKVYFAKYETAYL